MQGCAKKINQKKKTTVKGRLLKQFRGQRYEFEESYRKSGEAYQDDILKDDSPQHKGISNMLS